MLCILQRLPCSVLELNTGCSCPRPIDTSACDHRVVDLCILCSIKFNCWIEIELFFKLNIEIYPVHCVPLHWDWQGVQAALFFYTLVFDLFFSLTCIGGRETIAPQSSSAQRWSWKGHPREEDLQHDGYKVYKFKISPCFPSSQWTQEKWVTNNRSKEPLIEIENPFMVGELF